MFKASRNFAYINECMHIHIQYIYIYIYIYICIHIYIYLYICVFVYLFFHLSMYLVLCLVSRCRVGDRFRASFLGLGHTARGGTRDACKS